MKPPEFWQTGGIAARLLAPLGAVTARVTARRVARGGFDPGVPVFCAGNATMGGAGKTIVALELARRLADAGRRPHFLSRGYGGTARGPLRVEPGRHDAAAVGDEPLLLARTAPCWVGADRAGSARAAVAAGADVLVMDDGLQNPSLAHRHNALVIDGGSGFGNGRLFPAGPLREPPEAAAARCDLAILIGSDETAATRRLPAGLTVLHARLVLEGTWQGRRLHAFAGIARPGKFFASLEQAGALLAGRTALPDHHPFTAADCARLADLARAERAALVTTAKDATRLPAAFAAGVEVAAVRLLWQEPDRIDTWLAGR